MEIDTPINDVDTASSLSSSSALSADPPCICLPLHRNCDPNSCSKAAESGTIREQSPDATLTKRLISDIGSPLLLCSRGDFRAQALKGCMTCAILFAGLKAPPNSEHTVWLVEANDEDVVVEIKTRPDFVHVYKRAYNYRQRTIFTFYASEGSNYLPFCQAFPRLAFLSGGTGSTASFGQASKWLRQCQDHPNCGNQAPTLLPKRVIDIGLSNDPDFRPYLLEPSGVIAPYIALSHCWGLAPVVRTTKDTLARRKIEIDLSLLPQNFHNAITIARRLNVRFLWIDSLCIVQDDDIDWQTESAKMSSIYQSAVLTISAGQFGHKGSCFVSTPWFGNRNSIEITPVWDKLAPSIPLIDRTASDHIGPNYDSSTIPSIPFRNEVRPGLGHCFARYDASDTHPVWMCHMSEKKRQKSLSGGELSFPVPHVTSGIFMRMHINLTHDQFANNYYTQYPPNHLASRAWIFQERLLSTRVLHYTSSELVWECKTIATCQCKCLSMPQPGNWGRGKWNWVYSSDQDAILAETLKLYFEKQTIKDDISSEELALAWMNVVFHYSPLHLSNKNDRLPALSGLAKRFGMSYRLGSYLAGLWYVHLDRMLCWSLYPGAIPKNRPLGYVAPTWSWASIQNTVDFSGKWRERDLRAPSTIVGKILSVTTTLVGLDPTGAVSDGHLVVSGQTIEVIVRIYAHSPPRLQRDAMHSATDLDSTSDSASDSDSNSNSDSTFSSSHDYGERRLYDYQIYNEKTQSTHHFVPDSTSDFDVLTREHKVTLLLWSVRAETWMTEVEELFTCFALLPVSNSGYTYQRLGIFHYSAPDMELRVQDPDESPPLQVWFEGASTRELIIV